MTLDLVADSGALRTHLDESDWAAVVLASANPPLPEWAIPRVEPAVAAPDVAAPDVADALREALDLRRRAVVVVEVASHDGRLGVLAELVTDLGGVLGLVRRLAVTAGGGPSGTQALHGVEVSATTSEHLVDEVVRLLPPAPGSPAPRSADLAEVELPDEYTVAFGRALRTGDAVTVDAVCRDLGWAAPPPVMLALVHDLRGSAVVTVRTARTAPVAAEWLLTGSGWVELVRTPRATVRHIPRRADEIRASLVSALAAAFGATLTTTDEEERHG